MMTMMAMVMVVVVFVAPFFPSTALIIELEWYRRCDVRNERHKASARGWHTLVRKASNGSTSLPSPCCASSRRCARPLSRKWDVALEQGIVLCGTIQGGL